jgi:hypothetical protein
MTFLSSILLFITILCDGSVTSSANAELVHIGSDEVGVDPVHGIDAPSCGSQSQLCKSLHFAVQVVFGRGAENGSIRLAAGVYTGECSTDGILIDRSLTVVGAGVATIIDCNYHGRLFNVTNPRVPLSRSAALRTGFGGGLDLATTQDWRSNSTAVIQ